MQGRNKCILTSSDKIAVFKDKIKIWKITVKEGNMEHKHNIRYNRQIQICQTYIT
jgi:hypothetical protein